MSPRQLDFRGKLLARKCISAATETVETVHWSSQTEVTALKPGENERRDEGLFRQFLKSEKFKKVPRSLAIPELTSTKFIATERETRTTCSRRYNAGFNP